jgi:heme/copper-type cytochrome/quinol oxidase subunit 2
MNRFSSFAAEFTAVTTFLMLIVIVLFIAIFLMLVKERRDRIKQNEKVIHDVNAANNTFKKIAKALGIDETDTKT